jgi:hypothetical protein
MSWGMYCSTHMTTAVSLAMPSPGALWARRRTYKADGGAIDSGKSGARGRDGRGWLYFGKKRRKSKGSLLLSTNVQMQTTTLFYAFASALRHCLHMRALAPDFRHFRDFGISQGISEEEFTTQSPGITTQKGYKTLRHRMRFTPSVFSNHIYVLYFKNGVVVFFIAKTV